jgi:hypothetical protein
MKAGFDFEPWYLSHARFFTRHFPKALATVRSLGSRPHIIEIPFPFRA